MRAAHSFAALLLAASLGACGLPDRTAVVPRGPGPSPGIGGGVDTAPVRKSRGATTDRATFVDNFLQAAAGEPQAAADRVRDFLSPPLRNGFKPTEGIAVVRLLERPLINPGSSEAVLRVQQIGVLGRTGILEPSTPQLREYRLVIAEVEGQTGLFVTTPPPVMLMSDTALELFYERRPIYFWNAENTGLVPDVRYMPLETSPDLQPTEVLTWLVAGPAPWLLGAAQPLPEGTDKIGNAPVAADGTLQINLTGPAVPDNDPQALDRLRWQLQWSLRTHLTSAALELKIDHQVRGTFRGTDYLPANPAWRPVGLPERFCVVGGRIRRMTTAAGNQAAPVPAVDDATNRTIRSAALATGGPTTYAALVVAEGRGSVLRVGTAAAGAAASFSRAALPGTVGRPVWAVTPDAGTPTGGAGLVVANGRLWSFTSNGADPRLIDWQNGPAGVGDVAVAPDGRRVAVLAGGRLYVTVVTPGEGGLRLGPPRLIGTVLRELTAVDWGSEQSVLLAGVRPDSGRVAIMDVTIDGAAQSDRLADLGEPRVTYLAAYPANPVNSGGADVVSYMADGIAYDANSGPQRLTLADVAGPLPSAGGAADTPTAPFFLG
ncbi:LpqB family beta-propeller domain-containing protein [Spirilliplanes yamanashiensis]|uniref:Lipoprotein LpqB n=1 Tax=Spirilliplanes yamanashiensis TaxID=42233 RepID=A0A8J3YBI1_9ACTN|nr:LpqB family beta-propeller domain-containing protein [Spirilliplanes yamanashiensis]MDP9816139.1 hypothetical protein [Spirilliplanes yamanashiensis]GIJ05661.1 hypothetical protein Sya03_50130 [Spirilliplanes yamanashiensis]